MVKICPGDEEVKWRCLLSYTMYSWRRLPGSSFMGGAADTCSAFSALILDIANDLCDIILAHVDACGGGCNNDDDE
ncbi:hypothetical protein E2C01_029476 [Portunus trituberculatus]|uniref:Uncharacterized protein n=1 Tax=Portunus trituberculatus TaxID=210409 RepID=A0A5B7EPG6_PORTR|nr:hypothetical protein [Portunus trituberculatus]